MKNCQPYLLSQNHKLFTVLEALESFSMKSNRKKQGAFRRNYSTANNIFALIQPMERTSYPRAFFVDCEAPCNELV